MKSFLILIFITTIFLDASVIVIKTKKDIKFRDKITKQNTYIANVNNVLRSCSPVTKKNVISGKYRAKGFFKKGRILCIRDVYKANENRLIFNFGMIEIERYGKILRETDDYVKIQNINGKIEKIYKDGRIK